MTREQRRNIQRLTQQAVRRLLDAHFMLERFGAVPEEVEALLREAYADVGEAYSLAQPEVT